MKRTVLTVAVAAVLMGCVSCDRSKETTDPKRFPGFTQVGSKSELAKLYVDLNAAKREQGLVRINLVRVVEGGYVIQEGLTDCRTTFQGFDGVQYKDDGTIDRKYPGDATPKPYKDLPAIAALIMAVCDKANEARVITGNFDDIKALEILYGTYRPEVKSALWQGIAVPKQLDERGNFPTEGLTKPILSRDFQEGGVSKHLFLTATLPNEPDFSCHACATLIGGAIFVKVSDKWRIEREFPYLMLAGVWGKPPKLDWKKIGKDRYALFYEMRDTNMEGMSAWNKILSISDTGAPMQFLQVSADSNVGEVSIALDMIESASDVWEAKAVITTEHYNSSPEITEQHYRFEGGKYILYQSQLVKTNQ